MLNRVSVQEQSAKAADSNRTPGLRLGLIEDADKEQIKDRCALCSGHSRRLLPQSRPTRSPAKTYNKAQNPQYQLVQYSSYSPSEHKAPGTSAGEAYHLSNCVDILDRAVDAIHFRETCAKSSGACTANRSSRAP